MKINILGVQVDRVTQEGALKDITKWLKGSGRYYVVTPNVEMVMLAQTDTEFRKILNQADLAIPDSARFGWAYFELQQKDQFKLLINWPLFMFSKRYQDFPVTTGVDLMSKIIEEASENGYVVGFLGGTPESAMKMVEKLKRKYPKLKIGCVDANLKVDQNGVQDGNSKLDEVEMAIDILFVALGHGKQEKWIIKNRHKYNVKVMMGVGGAFDYISGSVPRAPKMVRNAGFEWLFRLLIQPWRAKRFIALFQFVFLVVKQ
jgi:N-acetylglucosaminyldiphosphoundecaprenol N-acetyl-beta-D-mannosaminyltransferase